MKELKFRVWSKSRKAWLNSIVIGDDGIPLVLYVEMDDNQNIINRVFTLEKFEPIIQQYTGLKDKNGKEIYEGDILKLINKESMNYKENYIVEVKWNYCEYECFWFNSAEEFEIIGNIFENKDLL